MSEAASANPPSRVGEFFKGIFWPGLFALPGILSEPLFEHYDVARGNLGAGNEFIPLTLGLVVVGSLAITIYFFATRRRARAAGVIAGFFATPLFCFFLFLLNLKLDIINIGPR